MNFDVKQTIDLSKAEEIFRRASAIALSDQFVPTDENKDSVLSIVSGSHLTYRYILVTALLAKSTNQNVNALSLQAGSTLQGAYDARSVAHGVVVPLERELLTRGLGGSNEPFLNKPARFPEISLNNAVRKGRDANTLKMLHNLLSVINENPEQAFDALCSAIFFASQRHKLLLSGLDVDKSTDNQHHVIVKFSEKFLVNSVEGQSSAILVGAILNIFFDKSTNMKFSVVVHPVNQSGASSKEIADIDVKVEDQIFAVFEIKDKVFTEQDADHAAFKAKSYGLSTITFIMGVNSNPIQSEISRIADKISETGIDVLFIDIVSFIKSLLSLCPNMRMSDLLESMKMHAVAARAKDEFFMHLKNSIKGA